MSRADVLKSLQKSLAMELTAAHQYQLHAGVLNDWGLDRLGNKMREEMQEEIGHADEFMNRIIFLKGEPQMVFDKQPKVAASLQEMFQHDMEDERNAIVFYTEAARQCGEAGDIGSRMLFEKIAVDEEGHMAWLELQLELIKRIGEPAYVAKHMSIPGTGTTEA